MRFLVAAFAALVLAAGAASAEMELSFYGGPQTAPHSMVSGRDPGGIGMFSFRAGWEGRSFSAPPHYGIRATWWNDNDLGWGLEINHAKVYADDATLAANGLNWFEFSDGLNIITVNGWRRWSDAFGGITPYVGAGAGIAAPHVEFDSGAGRTFEYQITGPAIMWTAGASYRLTGGLSAFAEYKGTFSKNRASLVSGGKLRTNVVTNALNVGLSVSF